jgi:hypothetical protein
MVVLLLLSTSAGGDDPGATATPPGRSRSTTTRVLKAGAKLLQGSGPAGKLDIHLVGFHPMKDDPDHQMVAHHFCRQVNDDFAQCALFDGAGSDANLNGPEYIISEKLFATLPAEERQYWHPHDYEILSGQLVAPGIPEAAEKKLMAGKMNSYGKTWHLWNTGTFGETADELPLGAPRLAWSFNHDAEAKPGLVEQRDETMGYDADAIRERRRDLATLANPQEGVDTPAAKFPKRAFRR